MTKTLCSYCLIERLRQECRCSGAEPGAAIEFKRNKEGWYEVRKVRASGTQTTGILVADIPQRCECFV